MFSVYFRVKLSFNNLFVLSCSFFVLKHLYTFLLSFMILAIFRRKQIFYILSNVKLKVCFEKSKSIFTLDHFMLNAIYIFFSSSTCIVVNFLLLFTCCFFPILQYSTFIVFILFYWKALMDNQCSKRST